MNAKSNQNTTTISNQTNNGNTTQTFNDEIMIKQEPNISQVLVRNILINLYFYL